MAPPAVSLASLLLLLAGGACQRCSEGRTYPNAVIRANLETIRIVPIQTAILDSRTHTGPIQTRSGEIQVLPPHNSRPKYFLNSTRTQRELRQQERPIPSSNNLKPGTSLNPDCLKPERLKLEQDTSSNLKGTVQLLTGGKSDFHKIMKHEYKTMLFCFIESKNKPVVGQGWEWAHHVRACMVPDYFSVEELWVSAGDNRVVTLPQDQVELKASVVPAPPAETTYKYEWSLISHPADYQDDIEGHRPTLRLSRLSAGLYTFRVAVSGEKASGEGFVNVTVKSARRVNLPPGAVVSPQRQELAPPTTAALIDGSGGSTDDSEIVSYRWEAVSGPLVRHPRPALLSFCRLTVTDSDGATNSTTDTLIVSSAVDHPPVANAGPNQTMTLPQNSVTLNGNQSSDDHQIVLYEWSLDPSSGSKEVAMQGAQTPYLHLSTLQEGEYTFRLLVTDSAGQQSTAVVAVIVQPGNNRPPTAVAGPDEELVFPVQSATLDGSGSSDDHGIVHYHWEHIGGPSAVEMENVDRAVATVTGLQVVTHLFRLTVADQQGLSSTSTLTLAVKKAGLPPPQPDLAHPVGEGARAWDQKPGVDSCPVHPVTSQDVIDGSDHSVALQLTNLVEGVYTFRLRVTDSQGASDMDTATVEVRPDPRRGGLVELTLQVGVGQLTEQQKDAVVRQLAVLLDVLDSDIKVQRIQAHSDLSTTLLFYVQSGPPAQVLRAANVARALHRRLSREKADFLLFKVLRVDTAGCLLECSGHGRCDPITKRCSQLWMENLIQRYVRDGESNCEWSIFYVTGLACALLVLAGGVTWLCICCCLRQKRTKIRKKTKYTILDNMDEQERMELRPKYSIKHRSTEHNSSLMVSESEFDSEQDTLFSREGVERGPPRASRNGSVRNGASFSYCSKDR
uniref:KIAA0319 n=1 Tax=Ictidomys tridecemlineatus TaxID=43179 RepID=A0A287D3T3_ICTTR